MRCSSNTAEVMVRLFNRSAQRYLVRRGTPLPVVGIPGPDLVASSDWTIVEAARPGTYHIMPWDDSGRVIGVEEGNVALQELAADSAGHGSWRFEPAGDDTVYQRIVDVNDTGRGLRIADSISVGAHDLEVTVGPIGHDEPGALWRIDRECVADARSIHLRYRSSPNVALFYNEVYPLEAPPGTFFCTSGFGSDSRGPGPCGYAGIQQLRDGSRIAIFSVWHRMVDDVSPLRSALATAVAVSPGAYETSFSGEGSGSSIRYPFAWQAGSDDPIRFLVTAQALGADTILSAYVSRGTEPWINLGAILRAATGGRLMTGLYGFIEDFARSGDADGVAAAERSPYRLHAGVFANPWERSGRPDHLLEPIAEVGVTAYGPHPLENLLAEAVPRSLSFGVLVATGTSQMAQPSPLGTAIADSAPERRARPDLVGIPHP